MKTISNIALFLSGVDLTVLNRCPTDRNKYLSIGATIFFTGLLAGIACAYALFTVFESFTISILGGLIWGATILNLDRYLILSMKLKKGIGPKLFQALPRLILAILIAMIIAKPLELKLFESEINEVLIERAAQSQIDKEAEIHQSFSTRIAPFEGQRGKLNDQMQIWRERSNFLIDEANKEADGTGGSNRRNMGPIYAAKKRDAEGALVKLNLGSSQLTPQIDSLSKKISQLEFERLASITSIKQDTPSGLASRLWALGILYKNERSLLLAGLFVTLLFISLECAPILTKLISSDSPYDYVLDQHERSYQDWHKEKTTTSSFKVSKKLDSLNDNLHMLPKEKKSSKQ